jgi:uncharacterized OB-fold protein
VISLKEFFEGARTGTLRALKCTNCSELAIPPKEFCVACGHREWTTTPLSGDGRVTSFTIIRVAPRRHAAAAPYAIAHVTLTEGVALLGRLVDIPLDAISLGMPVRFRLLGDNGAPPAIAFGPA